MDSVLHLVKNQLGKPYEDLEMLLDCLKEVLTENGEEEIVQFIPWIGDPEAHLPEHLTERIIQLYSIAFQLVNIVEINGAVQQRRRKEDSLSMASINGLWGARLKALKEMGITGQEIAEYLQDIIVEPVLTAHPTEAKRSTVLAHHRKLYLLLVQLENKMWTKIEKKEIREDIKLVLYRLWKTGEIYTRKPDIWSEIRNILHYLTNVFPEVLPLLDRRFIAAWEETGFEYGLIEPPKMMPKLSFGSWVGGDRDGHPLVSAEITREALLKFRLNALSIIRKELIELIKDLSMTGTIEECRREFKFRFRYLVKEIGEEAKKIISKNENEVFRQFTGLIICKIPLEIKRAIAVNIEEKPYSYIRQEELLADLRIMKQGLIDYGAVSIAKSDLNRIIRIVEIFGFHLAQLDIRQNSRFHCLALSQLMSQAALDGEAFLNWGEEERLDFINRELESNRPFTHNSVKLEKNAKSVCDCYTVIAGHIARYDSRGLGSLIVSMTRTLSDLLTVYLLAREAGLSTQYEDGPVCIMPIVPLFETIEDLRQAPELIGRFLDHPMTRRSLKYIQRQRGLKQPVLQIMIGYSDSNKDGGILASQWALYKAQVVLQETGKTRGVRIRFFHGKGGSISRGAGPAHYFIDSLPHSVIESEIRLTEQGETVAQKYANRLNAGFNLELLMAGITFKTIYDAHTERTEYPFKKIIDEMAENSYIHYRKLIEHERFLPFYSEATPIDAIEASRIGSRPTRRTENHTLDELRAIPWVFSWNQCRYNITGWYGIGSTLKDLYKKSPEDFDRLKEAVATDPFISYLFLNVETSLASTDEHVMMEYASLVEDSKTRETISAIILEELSDTKQMVNLLFSKPMQIRRISSYYSNLLRNKALKALHREQIYLLKQWRSEKKRGQESESTLKMLLLTVNAIAGALRSTG